MFRKYYHKEADNDGWESSETSPIKETSNMEEEEDCAEDPNPAFLCFKRILFALLIAFVCIFVLLFVILYYMNNQTVQFAYSTSNGDHEYEEVQEGFNLFDIFGMGPKVQEVYVDLSLEEIYSGYYQDYPIQISRPCNHCNGMGQHIHICNVCGGNGIVQTDRGIAYCSHCRGQGRIAEGICDYCHGSGNIVETIPFTLKIPAGAPSGYNKIFKLDDRNRVRIILREKKHAIFERKDNDIRYKLHIPLKEALLGKVVSIPLLNGEVLTINTKEDASLSGIQPFGELRYPGKGMPLSGSFLPRRKFGDLIVLCYVDFPSSLTNQQKQQIETHF